MEAEAHGVTRKELIRERVLYTAACCDRFHNGRDCIDRAIAAVNRQYSGILGRHQLEPIICTVICALAAEG